MNEKDSNDEKKQAATKPDNNINGSSLIPGKKQEVIPDSSRNNGQNKKGNEWPNRAQAIFTGLIFIVTTAYALVAYFQWDTMSDQLKEMRRTANIAEDFNKAGADSMKSTLAEMQRQRTAMEDAADANKKAVKVAEGNIKSTQEQFRLEQRAWINISIGNFEEPLDDKKIPTYKFKAINSGKTPAYIQSIHFKVWHRDSTGKDFIIRDMINNDETCYGPGEIQFPVISLEVPIHQSLIDAIKAKEEALFIEIIISYFDIYKSRIERHTRACFLYSTVFKEFIYGNHCSYMD